MAGILRSTLTDYKPLIVCRIYNPDLIAAGIYTCVEGLALVDTGATDVHIRQEHQDVLKLAPDGPPMRNECVGSVSMLVPYRTTVTIGGEDINDPAKPYWKGFGKARTFITTFSEDVAFVLGMNVLRLMDMRFNRDGTFELSLP